VTSTLSTHCWQGLHYGIGKSRGKQESRIESVLAIQSIAHSIPTKLPPAKLYLDDITEIWQILTDSCAEYHAIIVAGDSRCDTLEDLADIGGRTTRFVMEISSPGKHQTLEMTTSSTRMHIHEIGDQLVAWSKYANVAEIFQKRKLRLKSAVWAVGPWILACLGVAVVAAWMFVPHAPTPISVYTLTRLITGVVLAGVIVYYFVSSHSIVYLRHPHRVGLWRWLEDHKPEIFVGIACTLIGAIAARSFEKGLELALRATQLVLR
jgi:hypothetical protein